MTKEGMVHRLNENKTIQELKELSKENKCCFYVVGGSVVDILERRTPKDYDVKTTITMKSLVEMGFNYLHSSCTADTYNFNGVVIQVLKTEIKDFDFIISQSICNLEIGEISIIIDTTSFNNKILIPTSFEKRASKNALLRIPHWRKKGYNIPDETYLSLVRLASISEQGLES